MRAAAARRGSTHRPPARSSCPHPPPARSPPTDGQLRVGQRRSAVATELHLERSAASEQKQQSADAQRLAALRAMAEQRAAGATEQTDQDDAALAVVGGVR